MTQRRLSLGILSALLLAACSPAINTGMFQPRTPQPAVNALSAAQQRAKSVVEIKWNNRAQVLDLHTSGLDMFGLDVRTRTVRARITSEEARQLQAKGIAFTNTREPEMDRGSLPPGYSTVAQINQKLQAWAQQYPQIVTLEDVGDSYLKTQGKAPQNDILAIYISNKKITGQKPSLMLTGGVHARELAPPEIIMKLAEDLISKYGTDPEITSILDTREIILIPIVNVDGRLAVEQGNSWQRKNLNGPGVDLNRNFDAYWNFQGLNAPSSWLRGLTNPSSETYSGPRAASEPETQAVQAMYTRKKITMSMDIHAYGDMFFWPLGSTDKPIPEVNFYKTLYNNTFAKMGYAGGTSLDLLYPTSGTTDDYGYVKHGALSMGMEVGSSFRPSYSDVENAWRQGRPHWLTMAKAAGQAPVRR